MIKFNWATAVVIAFICFASYILFLVYKTSQIKIDLVSKDYYAKEIAYEKTYEKIKNSATLKNNLKIIQTPDTILLIFPDSAEALNISGVITYMRPSDANKDVKESIQFSYSLTHRTLKSKLQKGLYQVQVEWSDGLKNYYFEQPLYVD
ncbi:MAG: FixH family protein [Cytophagaceae bacterium]|nr:FixH family protein [Cytophagaceae bacterium]MDW8456134.1 FixH family protein [Cytophagaceae bacterium]